MPTRPIQSPSEPPRLDPIPDLPAPPRVLLDAAQVDRIQNLIRQLQQAREMDMGFVNLIHRFAFAPLSALGAASVHLQAAPDQKAFEPFTELVRLGPRALPALLEALDSATPTRLQITAAMWMQYRRELPHNRGNEREQQILATLPPLDDSQSLSGRPNATPPYVLTVGDVCFAAIGQIVGRRYMPVRYQPTAGYVINSPTHDPVLSQAVRALWSNSDPTRYLWDSLRRDYASRRTDFQSAATTRLLFYFPKQTVPLVAQRLSRLQLQATRSPKELFGPSPASDQRFHQREEANGVDTQEFLRAVSWCKRPAVRAQIRAAWRRASDPFLLWWALLPGLEPSDWPMVRDKLGAILDQLPRQEDGHDMGFHTLLNLRRFGGEKARPLFRRYLTGASAQRCYTVCEILARTDGRWDREFLWPMLRDRRPYDGESHPVLAKADEPRIPVRVCDQAAWAISQNRQNLRFELVGTTRQLDGQIALLRQQLSRRDHRQ